MYANAGGRVFTTDGNDLQSDAVQVPLGDLIRGVVTGANCDSKGACSAWTVETTDVTSGHKTTLNTTVATAAMNQINPAVLETYDVAGCDMLPAIGEITYFNHHVLKADGQDLPFTCTFEKYDPLTKNSKRERVRMLACAFSPKRRLYSMMRSSSRTTNWLGRQGGLLRTPVFLDS